MKKFKIEFNSEWRYLSDVGTDGITREGAKPTKANPVIIEADEYEMIAPTTATFKTCEPIPTQKTWLIGKKYNVATYTGINSITIIDKKKKEDDSTNYVIGKAGLSPIIDGVFSRIFPDIEESMFMLSVSQAKMLMYHAIKQKEKENDK